MGTLRPRLISSSAAGSDFEHDVGEGQVGGGDDAVAVGFVDQEILGKGFLGTVNRLRC